MKIRALKAFTIRDSETGNLTSIAYGGIAEVSDTVGSSLISDGLAEAYTLVNPTGSVNISSNGTVDVAEYATAVVNVPGVTPTGTIEITSNGTVDVTEYATAEVNVDYTTVNFNLSESIKKTSMAFSRPRSDLAATTVAPAVGSGYALFGGGMYGSIISALVDVYDSSLTTRTSIELRGGWEGLAATTLAPTGGSDPQSGHALFGGGYGGIMGLDVGYSSVVDAFDASLTRTTVTSLSQARRNLAATTVAPALDSDPQSEHALFGGGRTGVGNYYDVVDAYDSKLTRTTALPLSEARENLVATALAPTLGSDPQSGYALFAGGYSDGGRSSVVDAYDSRLTKTTTPQPLSEGKADLAATTLATTLGSGYALFGGGHSDVRLSAVDAYDSRLTKTTATPLSQARDRLAATTLALTGGHVYALFGGGSADGAVFSAVVDAYESRLTRTTVTPLTEGQIDLVATTLATTEGSGYALFGGVTRVVDVYGPPNYKVQVFPGTKYSFNGSEELVSDDWQEINISGNLIGYIKIKSAQIN